MARQKAFKNRDHSVANISSMKSIDWPSPFGYTVFCDDLRQEVLGKITLVGVYGAELIVYAFMPATLSKLAMSINYYERLGESDSPLELRIYLPGEDEQPAFSQLIAGEPLEKFRNHEVSADFPLEIPWVGMTVNIGFSPLELKEEGYIRVRMIRGDDEIKIGSLRIKAKPPARSQPS